MLKAILKDESGFVVSTELVIIATILVIGMVVGITTVRDQVVTELADVADAISALDQSFQFSDVTGHSASTAGTVFDDQLDFCDFGDSGQQGIASLSTCVLIDEGDAAEGAQDPSGPIAGDSN
jgi:Flp pilus assembly pilin Flp